MRPGVPLISGTKSGINSGLGVTFLGDELTTGVAFGSGFFTEAMEAAFGCGFCEAFGEGFAVEGAFTALVAFAGAGFALDAAAGGALTSGFPAFLAGFTALAPNGLGADAPVALAAVFAGFDLGIIGVSEVPRKGRQRKRGAGHNGLRVSLQG